MFIRMAIAAALAVAASPAAAQTAPLSGRDIYAALAGKTMSRVYDSRAASRDRPNERIASGGRAKVTLFFREDGSFARKCVAATPRGERPCAIAGDRSTGVWSIKGDLLCFGSLVFQGGDPDAQCYAVTRPAPGALHLTQPGGREGLMSGEWTLEN
jgi:hypothetical protein